MRRLLNPATNPAGYTATAAAAYALIHAILNARSDHAAVDPQVYLTTAMAVVSLLTRFYVTPAQDPRDGNGEPLLTVGQHLRAQRAHALATRAESYTLFGMCVALVLAAIDARDGADLGAVPGEHFFERVGDLADRGARPRRVDRQ